MSYARMLLGVALGTACAAGVGGTTSTGSSGASSGRSAGASASTTSTTVSAVSATASNSASASASASSGAASGSTSTSASGTTGAATAGASTSGSTTGAVAAPAPAAAAGFHTLVFEQGGDAGWDIDSKLTNDAGFHWYLSGGFYGASNAVTAEANGVLTVQSGSMASATRHTVGNDAGYVGFAFGDGFYVEASVALDAGCGKSGPVSALWGLPVEKEEVLAVTDDWPGQGAGYEHYVELDFLEWWSNNTSFFVLDWYGNYAQATSTCNQLHFCVCGNNGGCKGVPNNGFDGLDAGFNYTAFNVYGALVVPSQANDGGTGYQQGYVNGRATPSHNSWDAYDPAIGPPPSGAQVFAATDVGHYYLIANSTQGCPMQLKYVRVWQAP